jgi:flagellar hook-associated protein 3 FlgL
VVSNLSGANQLFLSNIDRTQAQISKASEQVSSGKKITTASDDPDQISPLLQLRANQQHNAQILANLTLAKTDAQSADSALGSSISMLDRAITLASQGAGTGVSTETRASLAQEVQSIQEQIVSISQTAVQGRYIFSGDDPSTAQYALDLTMDTGVMQQTTASATQRIENPAGGSFQAAKTASEIFDHHNDDGSVASNNVFSALNSLRVALTADDSAGISTALTNLRQSSTWLNSQQAFYGMVENRVSDATEYANNYATSLSTQISSKEDADVASAALELTAANTALQAAMQMQANLPRSSLFKYLG